MIVLIFIMNGTTASLVYQPFVMVDDQLEKQRAVAAEAVAKQERARAEQWAARLRALGIEEG